MSQSLRTQRTAIVVTIALVWMIAPSIARGDDQARRRADSILETAGVAVSVDSDPQPSDRLWIINTRHLTTNACRANLEQPSFLVSRLNGYGRVSRTGFDDYIDSIGEHRNVVIYVHGNRLNPGEAVQRGLTVYQLTRRFRKCNKCGPVDWVIWSWPTERTGLLLRDARNKAARTDSQGLYLSWVLRRHAKAKVPTAMIGYSFGARVVSGALHALAGGKIAGRLFPGPPITGLGYDIGFVAPAIESNSLSHHGRHALATKNMDRLVLLYNRRDIVLKRFWRLDRVRGVLAMGYTGPRTFAPRADGSKLPVRSRDCSYILGLRHDEVGYYRRCRAGADMATLIHEFHSSK